MEASIFIAKIFGLCYLIIGIGFLLNQNAFKRIMEDFCKNAALSFFMGMFALAVGVVIILIHNVWVANWTVIITLLGWGGLIKGIWMIVFPNTIYKFMQAYQEKKNLMLIHSLVAILFGAVLTYFGFFA